MKRRRAIPSATSLRRAAIFVLFFFIAFAAPGQERTVDAPRPEEKAKEQREVAKEQNKIAQSANLEIAGATAFPEM